MPEIDGCTVQLCSGKCIDGCAVQFRQNGWIRVRTERWRKWYPPHRVDRVSKQNDGGVH
jgi:hypothetical protein